jgi:hypothetical protein
MEQSAAVRTREIYRRPNGDRWLLARGPETSRAFVRHDPIFPQVDRSWTLRSEPFSLQPAMDRRSKNSCAYSNRSESAENTVPPFRTNSLA